MSTRCQIEFKTVDIRGDEIRRTIYVHSDGYPDGEAGVIATLRRFVKWYCGDTGSLANPEYDAANLTYFLKKEIENSIPENEKDHPLWQSHLKLGHGVCLNDELHGDIEFYYILETNLSDHSTIVKVFGVPTEVIVKKFPITIKDLKLIKQETLIPSPFKK